MCVCVFVKPLLIHWTSLANANQSILQRLKIWEILTADTSLSFPNQEADTFKMQNSNVKLKDGCEKIHDFCHCHGGPMEINHVLPNNLVGNFF